MENLLVRKMFVSHTEENKSIHPCSVCGKPCDVYGYWDEEEEVLCLGCYKDEEK